MVPMFSCYCWRALARKLPILYNGERKAKYVGCKIEDIRSRLCFLIPGHSGVLVNARESIDRFRAIVPLSSKSGKDTINEVKNGCLLLLVEVFMKVMNGLVMTLEEGMRFLCVWLLYYVSNFAESYFMRSFFSVFSAAVKCWAKLLPFGVFTVNCRSQLAGIGKKREETVKPICFMSKASWVPQTPETNHSQ